MKVVHIDKPFKIQDMPLKDIYVLDNWLSTELHHYFDKFISNSSWWSKTNSVSSQSPTGLPHHSFWGSSWPRQCPDRYTIRAGRNLPDKEFRYLRTVIVTAAVYRGFSSALLREDNAPP